MRARIILRAARDPWARRDAWRYEGQFSRANIYKHTWPGFSYGVGAFIVYCIAEKLFFPAAKHEHEEEHGHESH